MISGANSGRLATRVQFCLAVLHSLQFTWLREQSETDAFDFCISGRRLALLNRMLRHLASVVLAACVPVCLAVLCSLLLQLVRLAVPNGFIWFLGQ